MLRLDLLSLFRRRPAHAPSIGVADGRRPIARVLFRRAASVTEPLELGALGVAGLVRIERRPGGIYPLVTGSHVSGLVLLRPTPTVRTSTTCLLASNGSVFGRVRFSSRAAAIARENVRRLQELDEV